ncbi:putative phage tail protein [Flavobacterium psychrophilum]|uniref:phage tail tape measure protein n=1 Tax=Flavobacterium psychrophilum TaxID=96345 RepID=UPI000B7C4272|nr:phage tail tape measure protein [Flavobacterium psychrophilum]SNB30335.1 putative phage tail protein [Flavobacterium psychrophilum]
MAKTLSDEDIKLNIIINGNTAQKELFDLEKSTRKLTEENKGLLLQKRLLEKQGKQESGQYKLLTATIKENSSSINQNKIKINELQKEIGITGLTMKQLSDRANVLKISLRNAIPGGEAHQKYTAELKEITGRINELNGKAKTAGFSISSMADSFNKYSALGATVIAGLTGVVLSVQKIIDINGKLSDAQADVSKTTGMTKTEVDELTKSFGLLETRTSRIDLLKIAEQGGRLGVPKAEIQDFVKTMNMAAVSLGDSFTGGVDEVAEKLGKIKFLFKETKDMGVEEAYNSIGSAINDLGANGTASEANIAEFTKRIGSLTDVLKPTVQETLALGTAFEESGIEAETSSRAYNIFMKQASTESGKFAQVMGISKKAVEDMINTNPMNFMLDFAKGMNGMNATEVAKTLDFLGVNADGANKVIGAMGNNFERFHELIDLSNNSFASGTSLINEYNIKNETLGATLEKISKTVSGWFSSDTFIKWLTVGVNVLGKLIGATESTDNSVGNLANKIMAFIKILTIGVVTVLSYQAALQLVALWSSRAATATALQSAVDTIHYYLLQAKTVATKALALAQSFLTFKLSEVRTAYSALMASMSLNPWAALIAIVAACAVAYVAFSDKVSFAAEVQKTLANIHTEATKSIATEKAELELLTKIAQDETISKEKRVLAIKKLNEIIPDYIGNLSLENIKTSEGIGILQKYTAELYANARAKSVQKKFQELSDKKVDIESKTSGDFREEQTFGFLGSRMFDSFKSRKDIEHYVLENFSAAIGARKEKNTGVTLVNKEKFKKIVDKFMSASGLDDKESALALNDAQMKALEPEITKNTVANLVKDKDPEKSTYNIPGEKGNGKIKVETKDPNSSNEDLIKLRLENESKYAAAILKNERELEDNILAVKEAGCEKELAIENLRYERVIEELNSRKVHTEQIAKLDEEAKKALSEGNKSKYNDLIKIKEGWKERNKNLDDQIKQIELSEAGIHNQKLGKIEDDAISKQLADTVKTYAKAKTLRETEFLDELNGITTLADAKKKLSGIISDFELGKIKTLADAKKQLQEQFAAKELAKQKEHLEDLVAQLNTIMTSKSFKGIDLEFLTPEMREEFAKQIEELKLKIAELQAVIDGKGGGKGKTPEQQAAEKKERIKKIVSDAQAIVSALMNTWGAYYDYMAAKENAQLKIFTAGADRKKLALKKQLDAGYINQAKYNRKVAQIDKELDDKKFEIELKQAKRKKSMDIVNTIINTATAIMQAYAQMGPIGGTIAGVLITAMGALQIATIANTPLPVRGYEDGLYPEEVTRQQDGKKFRSTGTSKMQTGLFTKPRILVGEGAGDMPEMVIDKRSYAQISPEVKQALIRELHGVRGFENGYYKNDILYSGNTTSTAPIPASNNNDKVLEMAMVMMSEHISLMKDLRENGIEANVSNKNLKSMKNLKEGISDFDALRNKNKH